MTTDTRLLQDGDITKLSRDLTDDEKQWATLPHPHPNSRITIEQWFEAGDPEQNEIPAPFYEATDEHGCTVVIPADAVELVMTDAEARARLVPSRERIAEGIQGGVMSVFADDFEIDETIHSGDSIECYGATADGLTFGFTITVSTPWRTDA